jgi:hypothetical protein
MNPLTPSLYVGDCLSVLDPSIHQADFILTSPPYENSRRYAELSFSLSGSDWVEWCVPHFLRCLECCKGLVAWVIGHGKSGAVTPWSATPALLSNPGDILDAGEVLPTDPAEVLGDQAINCGAVGGGNIGSPIAHQNEAPFPRETCRTSNSCLLPPKRNRSRSLLWIRHNACRSASPQTQRHRH